MNVLLSHEKKSARADPREAKKEEEMYRDLDLDEVKYAPCPADDGFGVLLVDIETESVPDTDEDDQLQYYCMEGHHVFSVSEDEDDDVDSQCVK